MGDEGRLSIMGDEGRLSISCLNIPPFSQEVVSSDGYQQSLGVSTINTLLLAGQ